MTVRPHFLGVVLIVAMASGCSGGPIGSATPSASNATATQGETVIKMAANAGGICKRGGCRAHLVLPLNFNGKTLKAGRFGSCRHVDLGSAQTFTVSKTRQFWLDHSVTISASCAALAPRSSTLLIAAAPKAKNAAISFAPLAGPVNPAAKTWRFDPVANGVAMHAKEKFIFFVVAVPKDETNVDGQFRLLAPMNFDGTNLTLTGRCSGDVDDAPVYVAPSNGPLTLSSSVSVTPTCAPNDGDSPASQLYIVAVQAAAPSDDTVSAVAVAGPVNVTDNPWVFAPASPGLMMQAGTGYAFFIAAMAAPATPAPPRSYHALVPLNFDGSTFTVSGISSCDNLSAPAAYSAPATAPLLLAGPVVITPTCVPSPAPSSSPGGNDQDMRHHDEGGSGGNGHSGPLYIVATVANFDGGPDAIRPADHGGASVDSINGIAIAGPASVTDDPWSFAVLAPPLTLTQGLQYQFYVATADSRRDF